MNTEKKGQKNNSIGDVLMLFVTLVFTTVKGFFLGLLLSMVLNIIPILPAGKRSTFNLMSRASAIVIFLPGSIIAIIFFPLLFIRSYRSRIAKSTISILEWYKKTDLMPARTY